MREMILLSGSLKNCLQVRKFWMLAVAPSVIGNTALTLPIKRKILGNIQLTQKRSLGLMEWGGKEGYKYGDLDYVGDIWNIRESDATFDEILCTEVFEHIPFPNETIKEFSRLLKKDGKLILTAPSNCLRHMDPYFFYSGFSNRWYEKFLKDNGFKIELLSEVGDYYTWLAVEISRTALSHSIIAKLVLAPAFLYYYNKKKTRLSIDTLCMGYHIVANKI